MFIDYTIPDRSFFFFILAFLVPFSLFLFNKAKKRKFNMAKTLSAREAFELHKSAVTRDFIAKPRLGIHQ